MAVNFKKKVETLTVSTGKKPVYHTEHKRVRLRLEVGAPCGS